MPDPEATDSIVDMNATTCSWAVGAWAFRSARALWVCSTNSSDPTISIVVAPVVVVVWVVEVDPEVTALETTEVVGRETAEVAGFGTEAGEPTVTAGVVDTAEVAAGPPHAATMRIRAAPGSRTRPLAAVHLTRSTLATT
jgi:hypothetical protein